MANDSKGDALEFDAVGDWVILDDTSRRRDGAERLPVFRVVFIRAAIGVQPGDWVVLGGEHGFGHMVPLGSDTYATPASNIAARVRGKS